MNKTDTVKALSLPSLLPGFFVLLFLCFSGSVFAKEKQPKEKVVVYYFKNATKTGEYRYYSYIIADSIASEIRNSGRFDVNTIPVTLEYIEPDVSATMFLRRLEFLTDRGREFDAEYVIHGTYYIEKQEIHIKTQIFDVRDRKVKDIRETSREIGSLLLIVIDKISDKINSELQKRSAKPRPKVSSAKSPFIPVYRTLSGTTIGYIHGMGSIHGDWGDLYEKTDISSFYISRGFPAIGPLKKYRWVTDAILMLKYDFFSASTMNSSNRTNLQVSAFSANVTYPLRVSPLFSLAVTAGPGIAFSTVKVEMDTGMGPPATIGSRDSIDPYVNISAGGIFQFHKLQISSGISFSRIFYKDEPLHASSIYFGFGLTL